MTGSVHPLTSTPHPKGAAIYNQKLQRIHKLLFISYLAVWILASLAMFRSDPGNLQPIIFFTAFFFLPILAHGFAMRGAAQGKSWSRVLSKIVGVVCLLGFPIWTIVGIYILKRTGREWQDEGQITPASS